MRTLQPSLSSISEVPPAVKRSRSVLVVHNAFNRFVQIDCELLAKRYHVTVRQERSPWRLRLIEIWKQVRKHDLVFCWFASWHSFFPILAARLQGKPSVVVGGGYDTANVPQAGYGSQRGGFRKYLARMVMGLATHLLAISSASRSETLRNVGVPPGKVTVVHLGIAHQNTAVQCSRTRMALTVGNVWRENLLRKGLLPFVQAARHLPDVRFVHAGAWKDDSIAELRKEAGANVEFLGFVSDEKLKELYDQASVYVQASLHEGFGLSLAEAMAAGCIPVVTRCGALPEVVGNTGIYLSSATPGAIADGVARALDESYATRLRAQRRIQERFSLEQREAMLTRVLDSFIFPPAVSPRGSRVTKHAAG